MIWNNHSLPVAPFICLGQPARSEVSLALASWYWVHLKKKIHKAVWDNLQRTERGAGVRDMSPWIPVIPLNSGLNLASYMSMLLIIWEASPSYFGRKESCSLSFCGATVERKKSKHESVWGTMTSRIPVCEVYVAVWPMSLTFPLALFEIAYYKTDGAVVAFWRARRPWPHLELICSSLNQ